MKGIRVGRYARARIIGNAVYYYYCYYRYYLLGIYVLHAPETNPYPTRPRARYGRTDLKTRGKKS